MSLEFKRGGGSGDGHRGGGQRGGYNSGGRRDYNFGPNEARKFKYDWICECGCGNYEPHPLCFKCRGLRAGKTMEDVTEAGYRYRMEMCERPTFDWKCKDCGFGNYSLYSCGNCRAPKSSDTVTSDTSGAVSTLNSNSTSSTTGGSGKSGYRTEDGNSATPSRTGPRIYDWHCDCGFGNYKQYHSCGRCNAAKPTIADTATPASNTSNSTASSTVVRGYAGSYSSYKPPRKFDWDCQECGLGNYERYNTCRNCKTERTKEIVTSVNTTTSSNSTGFGGGSTTNRTNSGDGGRPFAVRQGQASRGGTYEDRKQTTTRLTQSVRPYNDDVDEDEDWETPAVAAPKSATSLKAKPTPLSVHNENRHCGPSGPKVADPLWPRMKKIGNSSSDTKGAGNLMPAEDTKIPSLVTMPITGSVSVGGQGSKSATAKVGSPIKSSSIINYGAKDSPHHGRSPRGNWTSGERKQPQETYHTCMVSNRAVSEDDNWDEDVPDKASKAGKPTPPLPSIEALLENPPSAPVKTVTTSTASTPSITSAVVSSSSGSRQISATSSQPEGRQVSPSGSSGGSASGTKAGAKCLKTAVKSYLGASRASSIPDLSASGGTTQRVYPSESETTQGRGRRARGSHDRDAGFSRTRPRQAPFSVGVDEPARPDWNCPDPACNVRNPGHHWHCNACNLCQPDSDSEDEVFAS